MSEEHPSLTAAILTRYFPEVAKLDAYLREILNSDTAERIFMLNEEDTPSYRHLVTRTYVGLKSTMTNTPRKRLNPLPPMSNMEEVTGRYYIFVTS
jgi:hypothetical protein